MFLENTDRGCLMVSDWGSIEEIATHGKAKDNKEAAKLAILVGCDMDMHSMSYKRNLADLGNLMKNTCRDTWMKLRCRPYPLWVWIELYSK
jgi:beta-glucosidase-like glycosyl hydrolase